MRVWVIPVELVEGKDSATKGVLANEWNVLQENVLPWQEKR